MALECYGTAVDQHVRIAFDDHATVMSRSWARAFVSDAGDSTPHDGGLFSPALYLAAVARRIANSNYAVHQGFNPNGLTPLRFWSQAAFTDASGGLTMTMLAVPLGRRFTVALAPPSL